MSSHAYIASDGRALMKVGKANDPKRREKQIALPMTVTIACLDEEAAHRIESQLRRFVIEQGGIRHQNTIDWFQFDPQIYTMLCEFAGGIDGFQEQPESQESLDYEIWQLRAVYWRLMLKETKEALDIASVELQESKAEHEYLLQKTTQLLREVGMWEGRYLELKERLEADDE